MISFVIIPESLITGTFSSFIFFSLTLTFVSLLISLLCSEDLLISLVCSEDLIISSACSDDLLVDGNDTSNSMDDFKSLLVEGFGFESARKSDLAGNSGSLLYFLTLAASVVGSENSSSSPF